MAWSWAHIAVFIAAAAILIALGAWIYAVVAIHRERTRRHQRIQEAVWQWAGQAATKQELSKLIEAVEARNHAQVWEIRDVKEAVVGLGVKVDELSAIGRDDSRLNDLRNVISELSDRLITLEAERRSRADEPTPSRFPRLPRP